MIAEVNENNYNMSLISKVKDQTGPKKIKKITKYLRNLAEEDLKEFSKLKVKVMEEEKKQEFKLAAPIIGFRYYFEDFKKLNSIPTTKNDVDNEGENTPSTVDDNEEEAKQIESSDFSADE